jgi:methylation protein EvaC
MHYCSLCDGKLAQFMDFGNVALAGAFLKPEQFHAEKKYRLRVGFCESCFSVQLIDRVDPKVMFPDYRYKSSATQTARTHFQKYAEHVVEQFKPKTVLEIGCNDGVMLRPLSKLVETATGVDPSNVVPEDLNVINEFFTMDVAKDVGKVDVVIANNVFAHIPDLAAVTRAVKEVMKDDGVFVFECHSLADMIKDCQYDVIYHEHVYYHSLAALQNFFEGFGMSVFRIEKIPLHAGSTRYYVCKKPRSFTYELVEPNGGDLDRMATYRRFTRRAEWHRDNLRAAVNSAGFVAGYGASGRANTLIQYCDLKVDFIVDDSPARQGLFTPGSHVPICSRDVLKKVTPDHILLFAWSYADEVRPKCNAPLIIPFPEVVVDQRIAA